MFKSEIPDIHTKQPSSGLISEVIFVIVKMCICKRKRKLNSFGVGHENVVKVLTAYLGSLNDSTTTEPTSYESIEESKESKESDESSEEEPLFFNAARRQGLLKPWE